MRLSWNEIRARAAKFVKEWEGRGYEKGETQIFYRDFFDVFGVSVRRVASFEKSVGMLGERRGFIDLLWKGVLLVEQKSAGRDLKKAKEQALGYFHGLKDHELPRFLLLSDFQNFVLFDLEDPKKSDDGIEFPLSELPSHVERFKFILGIEQRPFRDQDPVNIKASELVGEIHRTLEESGYVGRDLELFLVRIIFCLFADDTGIFEPREIFLDFLEHRTREDGSDLGGWLENLFQTLNTPEGDRVRNLDEDLAKFPFVNGELFRDPLRIPSFDATMREALLEASRFNWTDISPAIFGALFQSVMDKEQRREQGAHYTTEKNILKVIEPLFMEDLRAEFDRIKARKVGDREKRRLLNKFQQKLGELNFFDPACGCGNFLIIAYRELRILEMDVIQEIQKIVHEGKLRMLDTALISVVDVDQFYGIEISEFPARIAETALWMIDHIMNNRMSVAFGKVFTRIPLEKSPHIIHGDALEIEWSDVLPVAEGSFVLGNPPFVGAKLQSTKQRGQVHKMVTELGGREGTLDYVASWFMKAGNYVKNSKARIGFVATNSITQGEQVAQVWPILFDQCNLEIIFAHRTFAWGSDARGKAHVHVVILGLTCSSTAPPIRRLFSYTDINEDPDEAAHEALSPYLFDASRMSDPKLVVKEENSPINRMPRMIIGSKPIDNQNYIFNEAQRALFLETEPKAAKYMRPYVGAREYLHNENRYILALHDASPDELNKLPHVKERISSVRAYRKESKSPQTRELADTPTLYHVNVIPTAPFLAIPETSSEHRSHVPIAWLTPPLIPSNAIRILANATLIHFALLTSSMHMAWLRYIGGRLESRYRYSIQLVYNTFPLPPEKTNLSKLEPLAQTVLDARAMHPNATLAELYDPDIMPPELRKAHEALDRAVDRAYRRRGFASERDRIEHLFGLYEGMRAGLTDTASHKKKRRGRQRKQPRATSPARP